MMHGSVHYIYHEGQYTSISRGTSGSPDGDPLPLWIHDRGSPSCGRYRASCSSDRIFFRKDWDPLALLRKRQGGVTFRVYYERAKRASRARGILQCRCLVVYHSKETTTPVVVSLAERCRTDDAAGGKPNIGEPTIYLCGET